MLRYEDYMIVFLSIKATVPQPRWLTRGQLTYTCTWGSVVCLCYNGVYIYSAKTERSYFKSYASTVHIDMGYT